MNPTIQEIFKQLGDIKDRYNQLLGAYQATRTVEERPEQDLAGVIKYKGLKPFPFTKEIVLTGADTQNFGASLEEFTANYNINIEDPLFLEAVTASLKRTITDTEEETTITHFAPLASDEASVMNTPAQASMDFVWSMSLDNDEKKITADWLPSTLLKGEDKYKGYQLTCEFEPRKGEALVLKAIPLRTIVDPEIESYELRIQLHFVKMVLDPSKVQEALAR